MGRITEAAFPRLVRSTTDEELQAGEARDLSRIAGVDWSRHSDVAIVEAHRLADAELARRQAADAKATTYLAAAAALIPIALTLQGAVWERRIGGAPPLANVAAIAIATGYVAMAGIWAFRTLLVAASHRVDVGDLATAWSLADPRPALVAETLAATRLNWNGVNRKVSCIRMTHAFLLRAFLMFSAIVVFNACWSLAAGIFGGELTESSSQLRPHRATSPFSKAPPVRSHVPKNDGDADVLGPTASMGEGRAGTSRSRGSETGLNASAQPPRDAEARRGRPERTRDIHPSKERGEQPAGSVPSAAVPTHCEPQMATSGPVPSE